jgi:hypothetical protein
MSTFAVEAVTHWNVDIDDRHGTSKSAEGNNNYNRFNHRLRIKIKWRFFSTFDTSLDQLCKAHVLALLIHTFKGWLNQQTLEGSYHRFTLRLIQCSGNNRSIRQRNRPCITLLPRKSVFHPIFIISFREILSCMSSTRLLSGRSRNRRLLSQHNPILDIQLHR